MAGAYVDHFSFALGPAVRSVEEASAGGRTISDAAILRSAGFVKHHVCRPGDSAYDLARRAVEGIEPQMENVDAIVYATCIPANANIGTQEAYRSTRDVKHLMDFPASHLQCDFGLDSSTVIGLNQQACTGMIGSLRLARTLLSAEDDIEQVLCVTADRFPDDAIYEQAYNLISDGAAACLVSRRPSGYRIAAGHGVTNGAMAFASDDETVGSFFSYSHSVIKETLSRAGLKMSDIAWIIAQNTNPKAWQILSGLLGFDFGRVYFPTLPEVAHVISGDNIINLKSLTDEEKVTSGEKVLLFMAGYGLNWQCLVLEKC